MIMELCWLRSTPAPTAAGRLGTLRIYLLQWAFECTGVRRIKPQVVTDAYDLIAPGFSCNANTEEGSQKWVFLEKLIQV